MKTDQPPVTDEQLWSRFRGGDHDSLAVLYERHVRPLFAYGRKFSSDSDTVKDCLQDLFSNLLHKPKAVSETNSVKNYLMKALRNRLLTEHKRRPFWTITEDYAFDFSPSIEQHLVDEQATQETTARVQKAITQLTNRQQEIIYLKFYHDLDNSSIGEIMSLTYQAVCNLISRALKSIREILSGKLTTTLLLLLNLLLS